MTFESPAIDKIYRTLINNNALMDYLYKNKIFITNKDYINLNGISTDVAERVKNVNYGIMKNLAEYLSYYSELIMNYTVKEFMKVAFLKVTTNGETSTFADDVDEIFNEVRDTYELEYIQFSKNKEALQMIIYTYKYSYVDSFFENNRDKFIPDYDFTQIEENEITSNFLISLMKEFDKLDYLLNNVSDFEKFDEIPFEYINYLTQLLGLETNDLLVDDEEKFRIIAANILDLYRIKGTVYAFELLFDFLGYNVEIKQYYFDRRFLYNINGKNTEMNTSNKYIVDYYLTENSPADNLLKSTKYENVSQNDFTKEQCIDNFESDLENIEKIISDKDEALELLLGYKTDFIDKFNNFKVYDGNIYKYFKTNYMRVYPSKKFSTKNLTEDEIEQTNALVKFLIPLFIKNDIVIEIGSSGELSDTIKFDDNYENFYMLDSEQNVYNLTESEIKSAKNSDIYFKSINGKYYTVGSNNELIEYTNSLGETQTTSVIDEVYRKKIINVTNKKVNCNKYIGNESTPVIYGYKNSKSLMYEFVKNNWNDNYPFYFDENEDKENYLWYNAYEENDKNIISSKKYTNTDVADYIENLFSEEEYKTILALIGTDYATFRNEIINDNRNNFKEYATKLITYNPVYYYKVNVYNGNIDAALIRAQKELDEIYGEKIFGVEAFNILDKKYSYESLYKKDVNIITTKEDFPIDKRIKYTLSDSILVNSNNEYSNGVGKLYEYLIYNETEENTYLSYFSNKQKQYLIRNIPIKESVMLELGKAKIFRLLNKVHEKFSKSKTIQNKNTYSFMKAYNSIGLVVRNITHISSTNNVIKITIGEIIPSNTKYIRLNFIGITNSELFKINNKDIKIDSIDDTIISFVYDKNHINKAEDTISDINIDVHGNMIVGTLKQTFKDNFVSDFISAGNITTWGDRKEIGDDEDSRYFNEEYFSLLDDRDIKVEIKIEKPVEGALENEQVQEPIERTFIIDKDDYHLISSSLDGFNLDNLKSINEYKVKKISYENTISVSNVEETEEGEQIASVDATVSGNTINTNVYESAVVYLYPTTNMITDTDIEINSFVFKS